MTDQADAIVVGSGINGMVSAAELARADWSVILLERNAEIGGFIATEERTLPGYLHDTFSSWHPLFVSGPAYAALGELLHQHGLEYRNTDGWVTASVADDGRATLAHRDPERTAAGFAHAEDRSAYLAMLQRLGENMAVTGVSFVLPAPEQSKKSRLVRLQLLCWLARYSGYDANDKPLSQTNYDPQRSWREGRDPIITSDSSDSTSFRTDTLQRPSER